MGAKGKTERRRHFNLWWWYWSNHPWLHPRLVLFTSTWRLAARVQQLTYMFSCMVRLCFHTLMCWSLAALKSFEANPDWPFPGNLATHSCCCHGAGWPVSLVLGRGPISLLQLAFDCLRPLKKMLSSYYVHCGLVWLFCWARIQIDLCVFICLVLEVKQPAVRAYVSRSDCTAGGDHWIMLNIAEQLCRSSAWSVENYQECNTTFPKKSWCVYRSSSDVSGSLRLVVSGFDLLVGRNPAIAHCKFNSSWLPWKVTWWVRNPGRGETSRKLILSCRFHEAEGDTRAWFI